MLVLNVASTLQMIRRRDPVNATQPTPSRLPRAATNTHQETTPAAQHRSPPIALILRSAAKLRVSKDEGALTTPSVSLGSRQAIHLPQSPIGGGNRALMPATKGNCLHQLKTGGGGLRALARKTEGAAPRTPQSGSVNSVHAFPAKAGTQSSEKCAQRAHHLNP